MKTIRGPEAAALLLADHVRLEAIYERLLDAYRCGDWNDVDAQWNCFEPALRAHVDFEEQRIFPLLEEIDPDEADELRAEHRLLRQQLDVLGVNIELHAVTHLDVEDLIQRLRRHRAREERMVYPWIASLKEADVHT